MTPDRANDGSGTVPQYYVDWRITGSASPRRHSIMDCVSGGWAEGRTSPNAGACQNIVRIAVLSPIGCGGHSIAGGLLRP